MCIFSALIYAHHAPAPYASSPRGQSASIVLRDAEETSECRGLNLKMKKRLEFCVQLFSTAENCRENTNISRKIGHVNMVQKLCSELIF